MSLFLILLTKAVDKTKTQTMCRVNVMLSHVHNACECYIEAGSLIIWWQDTNTY